MKIWSAAIAASVAGLVALGAPPLKAATEKVLYAFCSAQACTDGEYPWAGVLRVKGQLYATTTTGGGTGTNQGTLNAVDWKSGTSRVVYSFANFYGDAADPESAPIDVDGALYGMTAGGGLGRGGNGAGTIYSLNPRTGALTVLHSFCRKSNCVDGANPASSLLALNGLLYGTTPSGGKGACMGSDDGCGTAFSFDPVSGSLKVLYDFCRRKSCKDGSDPVAILIAVDGTLYGTAARGGGGTVCDDMGLGCGAVFALDPANGAETVLHHFTGGSDGGAPVAGLLDVDGVLYGTTEQGGSPQSCQPDGCGTIFSIDPVTGAEKIVHAFLSNGDGVTPRGGLVAMKGLLYGTTIYGGAGNYGTVFSFDPKTGKEAVVYSFCSVQRCNDGASPYAGLIAADGVLYGTTEGGGAGDPDFAIGGGTIFSLTP